MADKQLGLYSDVSMGGEPLHYNWFGLNTVSVIGRFTKGNNDYNNRKFGIFGNIPNEKLKTSRPEYGIGIQDNEHGKKNDLWYVAASPCGYTVRDQRGGNKDPTGRYTQYNNPDDINYLFKEGGNYTRGFIVDFKGHYANTGNWYQSNGFEAYHDFSKDKKVYPFSTKGIAFTMRVPKSENLDYWSQKNNYGDHLQINYMHGLWMDQDENYYIYELKCNGDNHGKAKVSKLRTPYWNNDPSTTNYYFLRENKKGKSAYHRDNYPDTDEAIKIRAFYNGPEIEHLYFMGFSILIKNDGKAPSGGANDYSHTLQFSNVAPIPFYSPRPPLPVRHMAVLGDMTPLETLKKEGAAKIKYWEGRKTHSKYTPSGTVYNPNGMVPGYDDVMGDVWEEPPFEIDPDDSAEGFSLADV